VYLAELAGLSDPEFLPHTIATTLGLPEQDARPPLDAVLDYLHGRQVLLILDTCEHLLDTSARFASHLLRGTEQVTVLATSRQALDLSGESICRIPPLPVPETDTAEAGRGDAVELFALRAADAVPGFAVTDANRADVIRLCRWLDGIPLAIELATIRLRAVPLSQLSTLLEDRFLVLGGERRGALPHHQTLRTATQWSYDLCTPAQQLLWARLSVFAGAFSIADVENICATPPLTKQDVASGLTDLIGKSVLTQAGDRYRLLDAIREFGAEKLAEAGDPLAAAGGGHQRRPARPPGPPGAAAGLGELTSRQRQIASLVAEGLSNREIGERLVISKRTVDTHIDHIFGRLGVTSRMQLAALLASPHS
jgi:predicted ATPase